MVFVLLIMRRQVYGHIRLADYSYRCPLESEVLILNAIVFAQRMSITEISVW